MRCQLCSLYLITSMKTAGLCEKKNTHTQKKRVPVDAQGRTLLTVSLKVLTDERLIGIFHLACRYVSSLLATMINRTGELVALWQTAVQCSSTSDREEERYHSPRCTWGPSAADRWAAGSTSALPSPLINPPLVDTWPTQPTGTERVSCRQLFGEFPNLWFTVINCTIRLGVVGSGDYLMGAL